MTDKILQSLERCAVMAAALVTVVGFPLLLVSVWFAYHPDVIISQQVGEIKRIAQSENSIALNTMVFNDYSNADIIVTNLCWSLTRKIHQGRSRQISRCVQHRGPFIVTGS